MATKRFKSTTGYPVTVWATDPSGNNTEIRVDADEPYETDDKALINALQGSPEVAEIKGSVDKKADKDAS
jgi:hypothetical protein